MKNMDCFNLEALATSGPNTLIGRFITRAVANQVAKAMEKLNRPIGFGPEISACKIKIYESIDEFDPTLNIDAREKALAKLNTEDRLVLGLLAAEGPNG